MKRKFQDRGKIRLFDGPAFGPSTLSVERAVVPENVQVEHKLGRIQGYVGEKQLPQYDSFMEFSGVRPGQVVKRWSWAGAHYDCARYLGAGKWHQWMEKLA